MSRGGRRKSHEAPQRTCLGCRQARPQRDLIRLALCDGTVTVTRAPGGRGAYICAAEACAVKAVRHLARALRMEPDALAGVDLRRLVHQIDPPGTKV